MIIKRKGEKVNKYIENAIAELIDAEHPADLLNILTKLNMNGQDVCIEIALDKYKKGAFSEDLISLIDEPNSDFLSYFLSPNIFS